MTTRLVSAGRLGLAFVSMFLSLTSWTEVPRVLPPGRQPEDVRLQPLKDLDGYFPFTPANSRAVWDQRAERVRRQIQVALGLWPTPVKTPLHPVIHGRVTLDGYTVEKVHFESVPGFFVTGSLFRPTAATAGRRPAVLFAHGHWENGRFHDETPEAVRKEMASGGEQFEAAARNPMQALCVGLVRLGCVVFQYDMVGYADSVQIPQSLAHGFAKQRPEMNSTENWGLFSPPAESRFQSVMGLQTWNSIRALDFLTSLPDVDPRRVGVTGASGGGTQTFILCALDPRPAVAFPAVMVSTAMQGGCTCENACDLRVETGNVEFAALFAPKPLGMTAADDWTKEMPTKGFPQLQRHFALLGAPHNVMLAPFLQFGHNYNAVSRAAMYGWMNRHLRLGATEPMRERDFRRLERAELTVWDDAHPVPPGGPEFERALLRRLNDAAQRSLTVAQASPQAFRRAYGGAIGIVIGRTLSEVGDVTWEVQRQEARGDYTQETGWVRNRTHNEALPTVCLRPANPRRAPVIWLDPAGKAGLFSADGTPRAEVARLLQAGAPAVGVDLLFQGEFLADGRAVTQTRRVNNPREAAAYTFGYNRTLFAQRVHDVLSVVKFAGQLAEGRQPVNVVGLGGAGPWAAAACAVGEAGIGAAAVDTQGFRFGQVLDLLDPSFLPGGAKYGDLPGMLALHAPRALWLAGEPVNGAAFVRRQYQLAAARGRLSEYHGSAEQKAAAAVDWLLTVAKP
ncbi:MAG: acetylxylan esterase [Verrucomicrobiota bacterium]|jgi:dienelactone hydrolase